MGIYKGDNITVRGGKGDHGWWTVVKVEGGRVHLKREREGLKETMTMALERAAHAPAQAAV